MRALPNPLLLHDLRVLGSGPSTVVLSHGFGCNQQVWRPIADALASSFRVVLFDLMGCNPRSAAVFNAATHRHLDAFAMDLIALLEHAETGPVTYVGHSMSGMIGLLASIRRPELFRKLILVAPSPCYMNIGSYKGGFEKSDLEHIFDAARENYAAWATRFAPIAVGRTPSAAFTGEFTKGLLAMKPDIALSLLITVFTSDVRDQLPLATTPTVVIQSTRDPAVPMSVAEFVRAEIPVCTLELAEAEGHLPHLTNPELILGILRRHL
ncbi:pimeloyl-ACP methyl ester carboxylesterase [Azospirillum agricola]|uniref:alpha/beta fold hydrolase n=1 Tax=Azospirillum agricola TaxID=1720247 RepID=UPI001AE2901F|nr:alpha/beta hydrolase [Azospirillum agricola]MBP2229181.1 pimeloyl-ACP methyl ester carboxylesterase [Azospirillum agricola]